MTKTGTESKRSMGMLEWIELSVAIAAPIVNSVQTLPQLLEIWDMPPHQYSLVPLSWQTMSLLILTNLLWIVHGWFRKDWALILSGLFQICINITILSYFYH